jgi:hypothetical protein
MDASAATGGTTPAPVREAILDALTLVAAGASFLALTLFQLDLPGLYNDEAFDVIPTMQLLLGHPVELQRGAGLHLLGLSLPLMSSSDYQGVTSTYLALPFLWAGGINVFALRAMTVFVGLAGVILAFLLARRLFGSSVARISTLIFAFSTAWIFWSRIGVYVVSEVVPIAAGALLLFVRWAGRRPLAARNGALYGGMFLLGLGLTTKLLFLWFITAVAGAAAILYGRTIWEQRRQIADAWRRWLAIFLAAGGAFAAGAFPFLLYNAMTRGTFLVLRSNLATTTHGVSNASVLRNLWTEVDALRVLLDGSYFWFQGRLGQVYFNPLTPSVFALAALGLVAFVIGDHRRLERVAFRSLRGPAALSLAGLVLAFVLAFGTVTGAAGDALLVAAVLAGGAGVVWTAATGLRRQDVIPESATLLAAVAATAGTAWWFGGAGRPEGAAPGGFLGLWPDDASGALFWASAALLMLLFGFDGQPSRLQRPVTAILSIVGLVVAQSAFTVSGLWSTHLLLILPLPQIVIALFLVEAASRGARSLSSWRASAANKISMTAAAAVVVLLIGFDLGATISYHRDLRETGGGSTFSDAIYSLARFLDAERGGGQVVAMDWGFKRGIQFLTEERVNPVEAYGYSADPTPEFRAGVRSLLSDPANTYLFHTPDGTAFRRFDAFTEEASAAGKQITLLKTFYHRDGNPVYLLYTAR